jgi:FkbM family methyltransferase
MTSWMRLTGESPLQLVRIRDNSFGYADMSDGFLRLIVIDKGFEVDFFNIADRIFKEGGVFLDVGANHGLLSFGLAGRHGKAIDFHLFEPNLNLIAAIEKTRELYPSMFLTLNAAAVADVEGTISFEVDPSQTGVSHITAAGDGVTVPCLTLDRYIESCGLSGVGLLKLDVEGYELLALRGARTSLETRKIQAVYFEYFTKLLIRVGPPTELLAFLDSMRFEVCFCRRSDLEHRGGATHHFSGVPLLPVTGHKLPEMTDLMAVPKEQLKHQ